MHFRRTPDAGNKYRESFVSGPEILNRITKNEHLDFTQGAAGIIYQKLAMFVHFSLSVDIKVKLVNRVSMDPSTGLACECAAQSRIK